MTESEIDEYIYENLPSYDGWMPLLRELLAVLSKNGWNNSMVFTAKEKYGKFVLRTANVQLANFGLIIDEFEEKINKACMICGDDAKQCTVGDWDYTYCLTHYLNEVPKITNIDQLGFTLRDERYYWSEIEKLEMDPNSLRLDDLDFEPLACITLNLDPNFFNHSVREYPFAWITKDNLNWIHFLKNIPNTILDTNPLLRDYISAYLASFYFCDICGKKAVTHYHFDRCLLCYNTHWESMGDRYQKPYGNKTKYIKESQLHYFSGGFNYELNKLDISFEHNKDFKRLFSNDELEEFKQLLKK